MVKSTTTMTSAIGTWSAHCAHRAVRASFQHHDAAAAANARDSPSPRAGRRFKPREFARGAGKLRFFSKRGTLRSTSSCFFCSSKRFHGAEEARLVGPTDAAAFQRGCEGARGDGPRRCAACASPSRPSPHRSSWRGALASEIERSSRVQSLDQARSHEEAPRSISSRRLAWQTSCRHGSGEPSLESPGAGGGWPLQLAGVSGQGRNRPGQAPRS